MYFWGLLVLACLSCISLVATKPYSSLGNAMLIRGGKKNRVAKDGASQPTRKSRLEEDEEDENGDAEAEQSSFQSRRSKRAKTRHLPKKSKASSKSKAGKKSQLVPWGDKKSEGPSVVSGLKAKLEDLAKKSQSAYKDVYRRAKIMKSSAFEGILLRATWPDDRAVPQDLLAQIIKQSIPAFRHARAADDEDDPYHMTMHKLWTKMCEKDWRTVSKSLFILHCISRDSSVDACEHFASAIRSMERVRNPKKPDHRYFDVKRMGVLDAASASYRPFVQSYAEFEELKDISSSMSEKQTVARLKKAVQCVSLGLRCFPGSKSQYSLITGHAVRHVAADLRELWKLLSEKVAPLLESAGYKGPKASEADITAILKFYQEKEAEVVAYLSKASKAYASLRIKIPADLEGAAQSALSPEKLASRLEQLTKISGGAVRRVQIIEEDEDDDEEEEDDDEQLVDEDDDEEDDDEDDDDEEDEDDADDDNDEEKLNGDDDDDEDEDDDDDDDEGSARSRNGKDDSDEEDEENDDDDDSGDDDDDEDDDDDDEDDDDDDDDSMGYIGGDDDD